MTSEIERAKPEIEKAKQVRRSLEIVCSRLECPTPQSFDGTAVELQGAIRSLSELEGRLKSEGLLLLRVPALAREILAIRREVSRAQALLAAAGKFIQAWARLLGTEMSGPEQAAASYTASGVAGPVLAVDRGKVVLHG